MENVLTKNHFHICVAGLAKSGWLYVWIAGFQIIYVNYLFNSQLISHIMFDRKGGARATRMNRCQPELDHLRVNNLIGVNFVCSQLPCARQVCGLVQRKSKHDYTLSRTKLSPFQSSLKFQFYFRYL